jgi:hypothetical protein
VNLVPLVYRPGSEVFLQLDINLNIEDHVKRLEMACSTISYTLIWLYLQFLLQKVDDLGTLARYELKRNH